MNTSKTTLINFGEFGHNFKGHLLFEVSKSSYVFGRVALETAQPFGNYNVGLHLIHHAIETGIKAFFENLDIQWEFGNNGHNFTYLLNHAKESGKKELQFLVDKIMNTSLMPLLRELENNYMSNKYSEVGFGISNGELMIDKFDEIMFILVEEFYKLNDSGLEQLRQVELYPGSEKLFTRKLKQPFRIVIWPDISLI